MLVWGPNPEKHQIVENVNRRKHDPSKANLHIRRTKIFLSSIRKLTIYSMSISDHHHEKHQIREHFNPLKNDPQGALDHQNAEIIAIEFRAELSMILIYVLVVLKNS